MRKDTFKMHYRLYQYAACRRYIQLYMKSTKVIHLVTCKQCLAAMRRVWGRIPSPAELAATEADNALSE